MKYKNRKRRKTGGPSKLEKNVLSYLRAYGFVGNRKIGRYIVDMLNINQRIIIEVYGDYWHANPLIYKGDAYIKAIRKTAAQKWAYDTKRQRYLEKLGYKVYIIWEKDINEHGIAKILNSLFNFGKK